MGPGLHMSGYKDDEENRKILNTELEKLVVKTGEKPEGQGRRCL